LAVFDLITGTPLYFPPSAALEALDTQRAYARIEYRGGIEAYVATAARVLASGGTIVLCGDARVGHRELKRPSAVRAFTCHTL
jgi:tRNA1(Val) A37 N6-methylase TrmN6